LSNQDNGSDLDLAKPNKLMAMFSKRFAWLQGKRSGGREHALWRSRNDLP
jgi:hypothetical protein